MSNKINTVKGFSDHLPAEAAQFTYMGEMARKMFSAYGYREIHVPILEYTELFARSIGTETDVVQKEMFTFPDRKGRSLTLRPEATAGTMRSYIEHALHSRETVSKFFTWGPMFRYERPQKGRMRQFHQINCECLGVAEPAADAEMILMLMEFLQALKLKELSLEINTLGCKECRPSYRELLKKFLYTKPVDEFCEDCRRRMDNNPLRVLDCKVQRCRELSADAPQIADHVCLACKEHFGTVLDILQASELKYNLNPRLVRGLDYYSRTTFEVVSGNIGSQSSVAGGGRYDGLISSLGGPDIPGLGFACGMERLALIAEPVTIPAPDFYLAVLVENACKTALLISNSLRRQGLTGECAYQAGSIKSQMRQASKSQARYCLLLGENELKNGTILLKNMQTGEQNAMPIGDTEDLARKLA